MVLDKLETNDNRENHTQTHFKMQKEIRETERKREANRRNRGKSDIVGLSGFSNHHSCYFEGPSALPLDPCDAPLIVD